MRRALLLVALLAATPAFAVDAPAYRRAGPADHAMALLTALLNAAPKSR